MLNDIVYLVKPDKINEELRYSLRTVEKNFPYNRVWFYGGCPKGTKPDHHKYVEQDLIIGPKWVKTTTMLRMACENDDLTEDIWLFNDDFFIMERPASLQPIYHGSIADRVEEIETARGGVISQYSHLLRLSEMMLERAEMPTLNYATHTPLLINRKLAIETMNTFPNFPMFRCLYGNMHQIGGIDQPDVKINDRYEKWDGRSWCMSTQDITFTEGEAGRYIRAKFPRRSRWEATK